MNTFMNQLKKDTNFKYTENGALAHKTTMSGVMDLFAFGAAYRNRSDEDVILLFKNAFEEDETLALKCLFYIRDCRGGGQGERRFFRLCMRWLAKNYPARIRYIIPYIPMYGRYDDLFVFDGTPLEKDMYNFIRHQLALDVECETPSLLAKWLPSCNASSKETKRLGKKMVKFLGITEREYRKALSALRERINVLERLMSAGRWDEIEFDKIPSKAGLKYKNAFARRDIIAKKYETFAKDKNTKVNASTLYPYEVVQKALKFRNFHNNTLSTDREMINKYWSCLPDYLEGKDCSIMCVVDTSGSMYGTPMEVAISLGLYCAERIGGPFANHYISFSSRPQLIKTEGVDFVDKVIRIYQTNLCENTNLEAVFDLFYNAAMNHTVKKSDIPKTIIVISDMEIDAGTGSWWGYGGDRVKPWTRQTASTEMEKIREKWAAAGLELPKLIYWNVDARQNTILDSGPNVSFVSGFSPVIFKQVLTGKSGWDLCLEAICSDRYKFIH